MQKFTLLTHATSGRTPPQIKVGSIVYTIPDGVNHVEIQNDAEESLTIDFFSKTESDTVVDNTGAIVADTEWRIESIWCDDIKLEPWFRNDAVYRPRYFEGFLSQFPDSPAEIAAPYQFNFPGTVLWSWQGDFWEWYFHEKNNREVINFLDKDPDRVWKFRGSVDDCSDLVKDIRNILNL
jgi:hypothetical protein